MLAGTVGLGVLTTFILAGIVSCAGYDAFGAKPSNSRLAQIEHSPQWHDGQFVNPQPQWQNGLGAWRDFLFGDSVKGAVPEEPVPTVKPNPALLSSPSQSGLRVTWFGHSSLLVQLADKNILIDPLWGKRFSPISFAGPAPWYPPGIELKDLPPVDAVLISHDHYDHLDYATVMALKSGATRFIVPPGVGAHLESWGIAENRIIELDWWQSVALGEVTITATPARHKSGRFFGQANKTLWAGYALSSTKNRVWYSGDTGFHNDLATIGERLGPFDLTLIDAGQYDANWPDTHLGPELAVLAHRLVRGKKMMPVHWGLIQEARHPWTEPAERVIAAARCQKVSVLIPRPGESIEPSLTAATERWWPHQRWHSAKEHPVIATENGDPDRRVVAPTCSSI
ncbi:MBL fold metallo-hydrolase [Enterobacter sp. Ap-1006]|nr:MBL fold metallo-hydrolase [Enterobacter sp. Ap-1006]NIF46260.1 MBL fold metallo-hydrolase [Enterobacter sp. Ap-1006]